jgi:hypothetical protein
LVSLALIVVFAEEIRKFITRRWSKSSETLVLCGTIAPLYIV